MAMPVSMKMGVTTPITALTTADGMKKPEMGTFLPPFTTSVPVSTSIPASPNPQVRARFDDGFITM